jgi:hypothetical protein
VTGASGSSRPRRSFQTARPRAGPSRAPSASRNFARRVSSPPRAEDGADQRSHARDVDRSPGVDGQRLRPVVRVDAGDEGDHVAVELAAPRAGTSRAVDLRPQDGLHLGARDVLSARQRKREGVQPRHVDGRDPSGVPQELEEQSAVLGSRPAGAEHDVGPGAAVNVRHVPAVAENPDARPRPLRARDPAVDPEAGRLEVAPDVGRPDVPWSGVSPS